MPLILPSNSISAGGYEVANSLRFDDGSSDYLDKVKTGTDGNKQIWTFSTWVKRSQLGTVQTIFSFGENLSAEGGLYFDANDFLVLQNDFQNGSSNETDMKFRDTSAWYHIVWSCDSTQADNANRWKIYVNGNQETLTGSPTITLNGQGIINAWQSYDCWIGASARSQQAGNPANYFDGYIAETVFIDGQQLDPTSFGEFDADTGIWKPINVSGLTFGTNGFYLPFENSGALGQDDSGNGNNFTVNNLTSIDQTTDTPTNNFATGNPLVPTTLTYSNGNNTITHGADWKASPSTIAVTQGKWYAEMKLDSAGLGVTFGVEDMDLVNIWSAVLVGTSINGRGYYSSGGTVYNNTAPSAFGATYTTGDIVGIALDMDNKFVYFHKNGTYQNSGVPTSGASGTGGLSLAGTTYAFAYGSYTSTASLNFGNPPYTIASGNSDADGYGNFEYAVPSGYYALCTKNLAEFG